MEMTPYNYQPIDLGRPGIRLLRLLQGTLADDIQCELFDAWIDLFEGGIPYDALSYTWGSMEMTATITVNGNTMQITSNLLVALQHLRFEDKDRILWIDAICINQADKKERGHQVQQMGEIYKEAEQVIIWLGKGTNQTDFTMDFINQLYEQSTGVQGDWRLSAQLWIHRRSFIQPGSGEFNIVRWREGMQLMLKQAWFQRIWILQEVANARVAIILCGKRSVSARIFTQIPSLIRLQPEPHCQAVLDIMPGLSRKESWWGQTRDLHTLLVKFRKSKATDERDIIYALLGISLDACKSNILLPDYTKSSQQVIQDTASFLLSCPIQDQSPDNFLDWSLSEFLINLDSLSNAVLGSAAEKGQVAMVKFLLAIEGIEVESKDKYNSTPLFRAAQNGHDGIVKLLLETAQVDVNAKDRKYYEAPLLRAAENGHDRVVRLLLETAQVDVNAKSEPNNETPLWRAAKNGHDRVVRLLLETAQVDVNAKSSLNDETPLWWAAGNGHDGIVKLLLETAQVDVNAKDKTYYEAPLLRAAKNGYDAVFKLLLETGLVNINAKDYLGQTPLLWAAFKGDKANVQLLLETRQADIDAKDLNGQTPLYWAARIGHNAIVQLLLETGKVDVNAKNDYGWTPISRATAEGHGAVVKLLREHVSSYTNVEQGA